jgi:hypothetical protein
MTMTTIKDYYVPIITSKWFYFAILATVLSYIALNESWIGFMHDYFQFGLRIASLRYPLMRLYFLTFRYSIPFTEMAILGWELGTPTTDPKFADVLPAGTPWQGVWLQFLDDENVMITAGHFRRGASYEDMGFADTRGKKPKPNAQWNFLLLLAKKQGELSFKDSEAMDKYKKQKQLLSDGLKRYFRIDYDPFHAYRHKNAYTIKLFLMPPKETADVGRQSGKNALPESFRLDDELSHGIKELHGDRAAIVNDIDNVNNKWRDEQDGRMSSWSSDE